MLVRPLDPKLVTRVNGAQVLFRGRAAPFKGQHVELSGHYLYLAHLAVGQ